MRRILTVVVLVAALVAAACGGKKTKTLEQIRRDTGEMQLTEGVLLMNQGRLDQAERRLQEAIMVNPDLQAAWNALAITYTYMGNFPKAIETFRKLLRLNPQYWDAYNSLGSVYMQMGEYDQAKENLLTAANAEAYLTPELAFTNLALLELRNNRVEPALRYVEKGLTLNSRYASLHGLKGECLERLGKPMEALESHERSLALVRKPSAEQYYTVGRLYKQLGNKRKALDFLEQALGSTQDEKAREQILKMIKEIDK